MRTRSFLALALVASAILAPFAVPARHAAPATPPALFDRVAVLGASVTDGFLLANETNAMITFADVIRAGTTVPMNAPLRRSSSLFFREPRTFGTAYVDAARAAKPTLVIGVDFLFWFGYGAVLPESARLELLEDGLRLLEKFECPVIVGDFPDMHPALKGKGVIGGPMIFPFQVPNLETLDRLNARLRDWAKGRKNVTIVPLAQFLERLRANEAFDVRGAKYESGAIHKLLDDDLLHTKFDGTIALGLIVQDAITKAVPDLPEDTFVWDPAEIRRRVLDARKDEIEARLKTAARRAANR